MTLSQMWRTRAVLWAMVMLWSCSILPAAVPGREGGAGASFQQALQSRVESFDGTRRSLVTNVLSIVYKFHLPLGLEYVDRDAVTRHSTVKLRHCTVKAILEALLAQFPEYRVAFSGGVVDIYSR